MTDGLKNQITVSVKNETKSNTDLRLLDCPGADFEAASKYGSEYRHLFEEWVKNRLGYTPQESILMPYMALGQTIIKNAFEGIEPLEIASESFTHLAISIRRDDMIKGDWVNDTFDEPNKARYERQLKEHKQKARDRLSNLLFDIYQEDLQIEYSFLAELYLRHMFTSEDYYDGTPYCGVDLKALTIYLYTETYQKLGLGEADKLPLSGSLYSVLQEQGVIRDPS